MISYIKGRLLEVYEDSVIVENGGIGYQIQVPVSALTEFSMGEEVQIYTYLYVREDALNLYGFSSRDDLDIFKLLIGVNGIGPKGALGVLSAISPDDLRFAVLSEDAKSIARAPGIGLKTAQKVILELKDKLSLEDAFERKSAHEMVKGKLSGASADNKGEAVQALTALGYSASEAMKAVRQIPGAEEMEVEAILKAALKTMALF
ncbi:Holliday junction branch migration protein RuvA [Qiania dongpingensis]|uniref:Holliday junction branch migration complex subunit RuvA n=1 Tax=Qiania dongpingensis TaxID=2763669 RepID=A0A7G9G4G4_9FIRM|nr:Holliday junction branch migration protein RuvA [Qiania dongpingensis]QNM05696.1 Holliday junction branch migration protein RuvA [Qiania dongpingensis]